MIQGNSLSTEGAVSTKCRVGREYLAGEVEMTVAFGMPSEEDDEEVEPEVVMVVGGAPSCSPFWTSCSFSACRRLANRCIFR